MFASAKLGKAYLKVSAVISATLLLIICTLLLLSSWDALLSEKVKILSHIWNPATQEFGLLSMIYGSIAVCSIAMLIALPLGVSTAIYTSEFLSSRLRLPVKSFLELLAGIPSIIYGLIGIVILSPWLEFLFDINSGRTILAGGLLLAIMILPTIITLSDDALRNIPDKYRESSLSLGLYPFESIKNVLLPIAKTDLVGVTLLAIGRVLGETMAVMLVIGSIDRIPSPIYNFLDPGQTITSKLGREIPEAAFGSLHFSAMVFMGLCLLVFVLSLSSLALLKYKPEQRLYE